MLEERKGTDLIYVFLILLNDSEKNKLTKEENKKVKKLLKKSTRTRECEEQRWQKVDIAANELEKRIETPTSFNGISIWKIEDYNRCCREAISGKVRKIDSLPFYTSRIGQSIK